MGHGYPLLPFTHVFQSGQGCRKQDTDGLHTIPEKTSMKKLTTGSNGSTPFLLLSAKEAAKALGFAPKTLECWRALDKGPPYVQCSDRTVRYRLQDLERWAEERLRLLQSEENARRQAG
jgi:hypothetical protein